MRLKRSSVDYQQIERTEEAARQQFPDAERIMRGWHAGQAYVTVFHDEYGKNYTYDDLTA